MKESFLDGSSVRLIAPWPWDYTSSILDDEPTDPATDDNDLVCECACVATASDRACVVLLPERFTTVTFVFALTILPEYRPFATLKDPLVNS